MCPQFGMEVRRAVDSSHWRGARTRLWLRSQRELGTAVGKLSIRPCPIRIPDRVAHPCQRHLPVEGHQFVLACDCPGQMVGISRPQSPLTFEQLPPDFNNGRASFEYVQMRRYISIHFISSLICESNIDPELSVMGKLLILTDIREKLIFAFYKHLILISGAVNERGTPAWGR